LRMVGRSVVAIALLTSAMLGCGLVNPRPVPLARTCTEWSRLNADQRLQTSEAIIAPELMTSVRERQHLPPETADAEVFAAVGSSLDKVCELERRPGLMLTEIVTSLYR
jgi:predicted small lipoprotein YifL